MGGSAGLPWNHSRGRRRTADPERTDQRAPKRTAARYTSRRMFPDNSSDAETLRLSEWTKDEAAGALLVVAGGANKPPAVPARTELDADAKHLVALATARTGRPYAVCESLGYSPGALERALKTDDAFATALAAAKARRLEDMEAAVDVRAFEGIEETTHGKDGQVTIKRVFSDKLAEMRLKAEAPDKYQDRKHVSVDQRAQVLVVPLAPASTDEWMRAVNVTPA
jgi:hypothetical protein